MGGNSDSEISDVKKLFNIGHRTKLTADLSSAVIKSVNNLRQTKIDRLWTRPGAEE